MKSSELESKQGFITREQVNKVNIKKDPTLKSNSTIRVEVILGCKQISIY